MKAARPRSQPNTAFGNDPIRLARLIIARRETPWQIRVGGGLGRRGGLTAGAPHTTASCFCVFALANCSRDTPSHITKGEATSTEE